MKRFIQVQEIKSLGCLGGRVFKKLAGMSIGSQQRFHFTEELIVLPAGLLQKGNSVLGRFSGGLFKNLLDLLESLSGFIMSARRQITVQPCAGQAPAAYHRGDRDLE